MDYAAHYQRLMNRSPKRRPKGVYLERHHIIPKCMGGTDHRENLVYLTPEEHYVAHQLLVKMHPGNDKLIYAANMMTVNHVDGARGNKQHGWLRRKFSIVIAKTATIRGKERYLKNPDFINRMNIAAKVVMTGVPKSEQHKAAMRGKRPHVNQTGAVNNNAKAINTPYGVYGSISEFARAHKGKLPTDAYQYIHKMIRKDPANWSVVNG